MNRLRTILTRALPLSLGLAMSIVMIAKICFDLSYDGFYNDVERIYQIRTSLSQPGGNMDFGQVSGGVAPGFKQYVPGVEVATRTTFVFDSNDYLDEEGNTLTVDGPILAADTSFFRIFNREILAGNPKVILSTPLHAMISRSFAEKLGGVQEALGMTVRNYEMADLDITIDGVFEDFPENSSIDADVLLSMSSLYESSTTNWLGNDRYRGYVKLEPGVDPHNLTEAIRLMQEKNQPMDELEKAGTSIRYYLSPFDRMHTGDSQVRNTMLMLGVISVLLIAISLLNHLLAIVYDVVRRSREFATRKCFGAEGSAIYAVLLKEAAVTITVSIVFAAVMIILARPVVSAVFGVELSDMMVPLTWVMIAVVIVLMLVITAFVPGYIYNHVPVTAALKKYSDSKRLWKSALLVGEFSINVLLFGMLAASISQYGKVMNDDPGYNYENVYGFFLNGYNGEQMLTFADALKGVAGVEDVQMCTDIPFGGASGNNIYLPGDERELFNIADQYFATEGFFDFFEIPIIEGREPSLPNEVAVSRSFIEKMKEFADWSDGAIGKQILISEHTQDSSDPSQYFTICGVYEDYLIGSFNAPDRRPSVRFCGGELGCEWYPYNIILVKLSRSDSATLQNLENAISSLREGMRPAELMNYKEQMSKLYSVNLQVRNIFIVGCILSLLISIVGLLGYIANETSRRSKEIAIRKINGARNDEILFMFTGGILKLAALAMVIGDVLLFFAARAYLTLFSAKALLGVHHFVIADIALAAIVLLTAAANIRRISQANPVESIKNE